MNFKTYSRFLIYTIILTCIACSPKGKSQFKGKLFATLSPETTGVNFSNDLTENDSLNYFTYSYLYMGGGIAAGDINNDGLVDLYFTGNQVSNKLYLNKGNLQFEDITEKAGVSGDNRWYTGVTMADVNGDGHLDIYCSVGGKFGPKNNELFLNNGDGTFSEKAAEYGIDDIGNSVQATFFDYDKDGDLDLFVANYPPTRFDSPTFVYSYKMKNVKDYESGHLYQNNGKGFTDVTEASGLKAFGLSLSATVGDINNDSWPDLYVSNDFNSPDFMYLNNQDGTFKEVVKQATSHTAFYGMGADIADFNDDGNLDIFQVDMDAKSNRRKKANMASMNPELFWDVVNAGFHYQYMHNCMQMNSGVFEDGIPYFSNVSRITGTSSTDWSWGPLFADFDNDGDKDLFVSNGTRREINNNDYFNQLKTITLSKDTLLALSQKIPSEKIDNFIFKNTGQLEFKRANKDWGIEFEGFSNGVVYADLDNDGDLEIVTNNIDDKASVFKNNASETNNYIQIKFKGNPSNQFGLGSRVYVTSNGRTQMQELTLTRGFQSSVAPILHFGLGDATQIDTLKVVWPNGKVQHLNRLDANQSLTLLLEDANGTDENSASEEPVLFTTDKSVKFPPYKHVENSYDDFADQVLLPHKMSSFGPTLATGDLNNDGLDDYFIGGSAGQTGAIFLQTAEGFKEQSSLFLEEDRQSEDTGSLIFDADGDGDQDLYVVSGGYEFAVDSEALRDRLYLNDGKGNFTKAAPNALPDLKFSGSRVYPSDFDGDGQADLLVLGRQVPKHYPSPASSYILKNNSRNGNVRFDVFDQMQPEAFENLGMATSAVITDYDNDGRNDIMIVGEWMPIRLFRNTDKGFKEVSESLGLTKDTTGWWWSVQQGDFDKDGDMDYIVGNNGKNYKYKATQEETFDIFVNDFDKDNKEDIVLSYYNDGKQYPLRGRECSSQQIPSIKQKFQNYESFAEATLEDVYTEKSLESALHYQVKSFASIYLENHEGKFIVHELPVLAQTSNINEILVDDYDKDGNLDALVAGNLYASEVETPRNDGSYGLLLKGNGQGSFEALPASKSGLFLKGDVTQMAPITVAKEKYIIAVKNNDSPQYIRRK
ncbi:VCBS repeat-containing protein [Zobellia galactanivorans]|uniref:VCBS repeat-containing protein n=1 Tax=Zobellia galactanivorans (strain DSM 12802 / CCUG 47099 / CIP 106680 / NCIMB 13871 / Dsij) TaxID=63186 RepID=UPI001C07AB05|nr:VCBS repeat-containing protein [Zobellia galactanivorans]MBU3027256.1 VCBS repeat-containing protein [Zobellia galactanivorans]MDO6807813.1 VCBS repeat-containing protein [Zobellia galactanivorans]